MDNKQKFKKYESLWRDRGVIGHLKKDKIPWWEQYDLDAIPRRKYYVETIFKYNPSSVLELGCCGGCNIQHFPQSSLENVTGVDLNSGAIKYAKKKELGATFVERDITLPFDFLDEKVDIVCSMGVLIHIPNGEIMGVLANMLEVANVGLVLFETHPWSGNESVLELDTYQIQYEYNLATRIKIINKNVEIIVRDIPAEFNDAPAQVSRTKIIEVIKK